MEIKRKKERKREAGQRRLNLAKASLSLSLSGPPRKLLRNLFILGRPIVAPRTSGPNQMRMGRSLIFVFPPRSSCPKEVLVDEMVRIDPSPGKTILNIGCNKGQDAVHWVELWDMSATRFWNQRKWNNQFLKLYGIDKMSCAGMERYDYLRARDVRSPQGSTSADAKAHRYTSVHESPTCVCVCVSSPCQPTLKRSSVLAISWGIVQTIHMVRFT